MKAVLIKGPGIPLSLETVPDPTPGPGEAVAKVYACGAGLTIHHARAGRTRVDYPRILGHEIAGEVAAVGAGVSTLREGDPVALEGIASCGSCRYCVAGDYHRCPGIGVVGMTIPGGFAEYLTMPARHCFRVPDGVDFATAALADHQEVAP